MENYNAITIQYADGRVEVKSQADFKQPKVHHGRCTRCGAPVRWRMVGKRRVMMDRCEVPGQMHICPEEASKRASATRYDGAFGSPYNNRPEVLT